MSAIAESASLWNGLCSTCSLHALINKAVILPGGRGIYQVVEGEQLVKRSLDSRTEIKLQREAKRRGSGWRPLASLKAQDNICNAPNGVFSSLLSLSTLIGAEDRRRLEGVALGVASLKGGETGRSSTMSEWGFLW